MESRAGQEAKRRPVRTETPFLSIFEVTHKSSNFQEPPNRTTKLYSASWEARARSDTHSVGALGVAEWSKNTSIKISKWRGGGLGFGSNTPWAGGLATFSSTDCTFPIPHANYPMCALPKTWRCKRSVCGRGFKAQCVRKDFRGCQTH